MTMLICKMENNTNRSDESHHERLRHKIIEPESLESLQDQTVKLHPKVVKENDDSSRHHSDSGNTRTNVKYRRRTCKFANCNRVVKSQGVCQRHGARTKLCRAIGCQKQAQGGFEGFCKCHFRSKEFVATVLNVPSNESTSPAIGKDQTNPDSINSCSLHKKQSNIQYQKDTLSILETQSQTQSSYATQFTRNLEVGFSKQYPSGWYRRHKRLSRNIRGLVDQNTPLEPWELKIISNETKLITSQGGHSIFLHFAHAWGQEYGFHLKSAQQLHSFHNNPFDTNDQGSEAIRTQYGTKSIKDNDASRESLEASYEAFVSESKDSSTMPLFENPDAFDRELFGPHRKI